MKSGWLLTIVVSLILAGGAAWYANNMLNEQLRQVKSVEVELFPVVTAAVDIQAGTTVDDTHLKVVGVPAAAKPEGAYTDKAALVGQIAKQSVYAGEIIVAERFANSPGASALAALISEGKRAITVAVNNVVGVSGFILPGSRVDIISMEGNEPRTILENIKVLAVGQLLNPEKSEPVKASAVTLEVDPQQAEIIVKARNLRLTLRNPDDSLVVAANEPGRRPPSSEDATETVQAESRTEPEPPRYVSMYVVDVVRGTSVSTTSIDW